jgi:hypothetical protein
MKIEIKGLSELTKNLDQLNKAIGGLDGEIASLLQVTQTWAGHTH